MTDEQTNTLHTFYENSREVCKEMPESGCRSNPRRRELVHLRITHQCSDKGCRNNDMRNINTFKGLVNSEISLSWNTNNNIR